MADVDVLIPTCDRPGPLAVTLACLIGQTYPSFRVVISDQSEGLEVAEVGEVQAVTLVLGEQGHDVEVHRHLPRRGLAEQRQFLLDQAQGAYALFLDDDVIIEGDLLERLVRAISREGCGFVGSFPNAPSAVRSDKPVDEPPPQVAIEEWTGPVVPERVEPDTPEWERSQLHFAAYLRRLVERAGITKEDERLYKVAWIGGCVLFDTAKLRSVGGFSFWPRLPPEHSGEDVLAQMLVMAEHGGAGIVPSGAWHQEVPTTCSNRDVDAPYRLALS